MKKFYYLSTCDTCKRIMKELDLSEFDKIDIKKENINSDDLELARKTVDSYTELFNKRAEKFQFTFDISVSTGGKSKT